jgi:phage recombination protein Bet
MTTTTTTATEGTEDWQKLIDDAQAPQANSLATIRPDQQRWDDNQLAILRQLGVEDATQADVDLFFHYCRTTGLDPFRKQIYMIGRNTKVAEWVEDDRAQNGRRKVERWVTKYTIQVGIDGYRRNGREAAKMLGDTLAFEGPFFTGKDDYIELDDGRVIQRWREVWPEDTPPYAAKFVVIRNGEHFPAIVKYSEFVQTVPMYEGQGQQRQKVGERPNEVWSKSPCNQTAKCSEALAWRRAYPDDFAGLILEDAAQPTVIDQDGNVESESPRRRPGGAGVDGMRAARERREAQRQQPTVVDAEPAEPAPPTPTGNQQTMSPPTRKKWLNRMFQLLNDEGEGDCQDRDDQLIVIVGTAAAAGIPGLALEHRDGLTDDQLRAVVNQMNAWSKGKRLAHEVTEILNKASLAELAAEQAAADAAAAAAEAAADEASENAEADLAAREAGTEGATE